MSNEFFFSGSTDHLQIMEQSYNLGLVFLSYIIASFASYVFLDIAGKIREKNNSYQSNRWWLLGGAFAMGTGIWSMHFTGMLALMTSMTMHYEAILTIVSIVIAILASGCALYLLMKVENFRIIHYVLGGIIIGLAISTMHYLGMEAMKIDINIQYIPSIFFLAIAIAIVASMVALWLAIQSNKGTFRRKLVLKIVSALIMGVAVCGMHYTGMYAAIMTHLPSNMTAKNFDYYSFNSDNLSFYIVMAEMLIIALMIFTSTYSQLVTNPLIEKLKLQNVELLLIKESLEKSKIEAEVANKTKSSFLANMSHELRTPLNAIIGYSELMLEEAEDTNSVAAVSDLKKVISSAKHLLSLINDILDLSKIEAGKMELFLENVEILSFLDELKIICEPILEKNQNKFHIQVADNIGTMCTDVTRARQCILNLLSNSSKFTIDGDITLKVSRLSKHNQDWIKIEVSDTGIGMTEEQLKKMFQAFSQADVSTTRKFGGTGLGLYLTQRFCDMLGGSISVSSIFGEGTTFVITFPASSSANGKTSFEAPKMPLRTDVSKSTKPSILIIDDDPNVHKLLEERLKSLNYTILHAYNGEKGYKIAKEFRPNLIILDIIMPGIDGWALLSQFKSDSVLKDVKVILISMILDKDLGLALGAIDYFQKPLDFDKIKDRILELLTIDTDSRILVVDDDVNARQIMVRAIKKLSAIPFEAKNGLEALEFLKKTESLPSLILLDLMMPEMDGFTFIHHLQQNEKWSKIPVVVITSKELTYEERVALTNSTERILQKSSNTKDVIMSICQQVNQKLQNDNDVEKELVKNEMS